MIDEDHYIGRYDDGYGVYDLFWTLNRYNNGRIALEIDSIDSEGNEETYAVVTINLPDVSIPENAFTYSCGTECYADNFAFINGDLTEEFKKYLRDKNIISYPYRTVKYNYGTYELCEILVKEQ